MNDLQLRRANIEFQIYQADRCVTGARECWLDLKSDDPHRVMLDRLIEAVSNLREAVKALSRPS